MLPRNGTLANKEPRILEIKYPRRSRAVAIRFAVGSSRSRLKYPVTFNIADISSIPAITACTTQLRVLPSRAKDKGFSIIPPKGPKGRGNGSATDGNRKKKASDVVVVSYID